ncbi:hypothetical protein FSARC_10019 [Fusarium sarcochroum]|uniref:Major facilitator superfamily (MFS) profile domain-containing protein n=1 Tax=Fusarium sarcochroum TaxID=1208366 RepID=A0A8H4X5M2_9HYPO|nr:hypothetical protein FSARC_10019 [Fusarium sarcochroum]
MARTKSDDCVVQVDERTPLISPTNTECETFVEDSKTPPTAVVWLIFPILLAGIFLSNVVSSIVIATGQRIASEFNALSSAAWLLTAYTLAQASTQPLYGKLSDIYGRRKCLIFCWLVFGLGCLIVAAGQSYWHILAGRALSGIGSAGKIALTSIIVADLIPLHQVAHYRAYINLTATIARMLGGPIGGWLAGSVGWRWPFLAQFPLALLGLGLVLWKLPEPKHDETQAKDVSEPTESQINRVDFLGAITLICTILTGLLSLDLATKEGIGAITISLVAAFGLFLTLFYVVETYWAKEPILPLDLVLKRDILTSYLIICFQAAGQFGLLYSIPIYFQVVERESISSSSTRIVPVVFGNAAGTILSQRLITRMQKYKGLTAFGNIAGLAGFTLILVFWHGKVYWFQALFVALPGMGMGIVQSSTFIHLAACLNNSEIAIAGASWFLAQNIGVLIGASFSTASINYALKLSLDNLLNGVEGKEQIIKHATSDVKYIQGLPHNVWTLVTKAYVQAISCSHGSLLLPFITNISCSRDSTPSMRRLAGLSKEELLKKVEALESSIASSATQESPQPDSVDHHIEDDEVIPEGQHGLPSISVASSPATPSSQGSRARASKGPTLFEDHQQLDTHQHADMENDDIQVRREVLTTYLESMHRRVPLCDYAEILSTNEASANVTLSTSSARMQILRLNMACAIGATIRQLTGDALPLDPEKYFLLAMDLRHSMEEKDLIQQVEIDLWIVLYKLRTCFSSEVWYLIGHAMRTAIDAGLHRERYYQFLNSSEAELRRCLFWAVYALERNICWSLKRPFSLADHDIDTKLPAPLQHPTWIDNKNDSLDARRERSDGPQRPLDKRVFIATINLSRINSQVYSQIYQADQSKASRDQIPQLLDKIRLHEMSLSDCSAQDQDFLQLHVKNATRVLIEPFLPELHPSDYLVKTCLDAAGGMCQIFKRLRLNRSLGYSFTMINSVFVAGMTICYIVTMNPSLWTPAKANDLRACSASLFAAAERNNAIRKYRDTLDTIIEAVSEYVEQVSSSIDGLAGPHSHETPGKSADGESSPQYTFDKLGHALKAGKFEFPFHSYPIYCLEPTSFHNTYSNAPRESAGVGTRLALHHLDPFQWDFGASISDDIDLTSMDYVFTANGYQ